MTSPCRQKGLFPAVREGVGYEVVHEVEARRPGDHDVGGVDAKDPCGKGTRGGQPLGGAVVVDDRIAVREVG